MEARNGTKFYNTNYNIVLLKNNDKECATRRIKYFEIAKEVDLVYTRRRQV